ncbi:MAG: thermonuclease family protein [Sphingomicrobium sp.]
MHFGSCYVGGGTNCVVDGDTFWLKGEDIRIADIDAPETHDWHCPSEKALGDKATERLQELLNSGAVTLEAVDRDEDVYGRKLRLVYVNGTSVGETLIREGLAHRYVHGKLPWC